MTSSIGTPRGAWLQVEGFEDVIELGPDALVTRGAAIDPASQTLPILYAIDNTSGTLPLGASARVWLVTGEERQAIVVPTSAIVDDGGTSVVFVEVEGEAFERRIVRLGLRDRGFVEVTSGIAVGEHVVTRGAWSVKLAASSGSVPAHGHAH